ncbi:hypothetical protein [Tenacibaculum maritimum]|uniref:hypothetical protein n=1 Tax=Tenacibaculum maritimum TaxID=107401 RepID=UPI0012E5D3BA|nr:hypothetical protein [Tenacibaculum maritimum]MCD9561676.1 hypothetical protein [Tenacibaculum maritimum]MCD9564683.1 hypothetical protein [Tenacibaculum maritimum]MCD9577812.1 hypothetical protein [Tenacibaculum maritimum]MCD9580499.1 hypothetical protein [Tenacibaculum maritimum]MCD9585655.1 hypothetical protein [Tenacibaculum maritimum]
MPYIEEEKFLLMQQDFDNAKLGKEEAEKELEQIKQDLIKYKKGSKKTSILLGILIGLLAASTLYFYNRKATIAPTVDIAAIKAAEAERVLDSISSLEIVTKTSSDTPNEALGSSEESLEENIHTIKNNTNNQLIYSVQVGVFSAKKYPLISSKFLPGTITNKNGYFKYSLGLFSSLGEAKFLKKELTKIGFKDAFVASYKGGKRLKIHN